MVLNKIFLDTSWFKALIDIKDDFHSDALEQFNKLKLENRFLITTNFVIDESLTLIRVKTGLQLALKFRDTLFEMSQGLKIVRVLDKDEKNAWEWFLKKWNRLSFTDCTSFAVMRRLELRDVATFDEHFTLAGFKIFKSKPRRRGSR